MRKEKDLQVLLPDGSTRPLSTFLWPTAALMLAAFLLVISIFLPYWQMVLRAPQYPDGLRSVVYVNHLEGDSQEIDQLNHYLGMPPLNEGGKLERQTSIIAIATMALLLLAATFIHDQRAAIFAIPAIAYPLIFLADLQYILYTYGHSIDPKSALGSAIKPFTPPIFGDGTVGQFGTESSFGPGFYMAVASSLTVLAALWLHRAAWRPVVMARRKVTVRAPGALATASVALAVLAACTLPAEAATVRTVGSGQAYATVSTAVAACTDGDVVRVLPGVYHERLVVDRSITLEGIDRPVIDGDGRGTVVSLTRPDITMRGFVVRNSGVEPDEDDSGIHVTAARVRVEDNRLEEVLFGVFAARTPGVVIRGNDIGGKSQYDSARRGDGIRLWYCKNATVEENRLHNTRDLVAWYCEDVIIRNNDVERDRYGIHFMYSNGARVSGNRLRHNSVGIYTMYSRGVVIERNDVVGCRGPSGYALGFKDVDDITVTDNNLLDNRVGIFMDGAPLAIDSFCRIRGNLLAYNDIGVSMLPSVKRASFERNQWVENEQQVSVLGGGTAMENLFADNFWSDYAGFDADGDGVGDFPYRSDELFENLADRSASMRMFHMSLAQQAVDTAARLFPLVKPVPRLEDSRPQARMDAPALAAVVPAVPLDRPGAGLLAGLLALAAGLWRAFRARTARRRARWSDRCARPCVRRDEASSQAMIHVDGLTKNFGAITAVDDIRLTVREGEAVALWGSNGAGKTTILRCVLGLLDYPRGRITVRGLDAKRDGCRARALIGYVPQELRFHDDMTVEETMQFYASLRGLRLEDVGQRLGTVDLDGHASKRVGQLSGGMKQRLALALALLGDPPVLLLDEPTSNLDLKGRQEFMCLLQRLKEQGKTMLFSAHHLEEVAPLADRVVLLEHATVVRECTPLEFRHGVAGEQVMRIHVAASDYDSALATLQMAGYAGVTGGR